MLANAWYYSEFWGSFWGQMIIEIVGGTIGALIFLFIVLFFIRPRIKIADFFCEVTDVDGSLYYSFKFVNRSFFNAHHAQVELYKMRRIPMGNGCYNNICNKITLVNGIFNHVPGRPLTGKTQDNQHCILVRSTENIKEVLTPDENSILLKISLNHGLTGLSGVFEQEYANLSDIRSGRFKPGTKFGSM